MQLVGSRRTGSSVTVGPGFPPGERPVPGVGAGGRWELPGLPLRPHDPDEIGPYRLRRVLGEGGMGTVYYAARDGAAPVAVKAIRSEYVLAPGFRGRFLREIENARQVQPFCTAAVLDFDTGDTPYLVTEYVNGPDLRQQITSGVPLSEHDTKRFAIGVASALRAIHNAGVVHRDLKPANVLLAVLGPRVIDFGVAAALVGPARTGADRGDDPDVPQWLTPAYMAPEQAQRARHQGSFDISRPADVFAWAGVVLYAATGRAPFGEGSFAELFDRVVYEEPDLSGLAPDLEVIVRRALHKNPYRRPDAGQLIASLLGDAEVEPADQVWETTIIAPPRQTVPEPTGRPPDLRSLNGDAGGANGAGAGIATGTRAPEPGRPRRRRRAVAGLIVAIAAVLALVAVLVPTSPISPWHPSAQLGACANVNIYTGQHGTPYNAYGKELAARITKRYPGTTVDVLATNGTGDNLLRLQDPAGATCATAVVQLNTTVDARFGVNQFSNMPLTDLRTVGPLWFDLLHLIVRADSPITTAAQLCDRRISTGLKSSGTEQLGQVLFQNLLKCTPSKVASDLPRGLADLAAGRIDGLLWAGGAPTPQIVRALGDGLRIRLLPLADELPAMMANWDAAYRFRLGDRFIAGRVYESVPVTSGDYGDVPAVNTIGAPNGLVVDKGADPDLVAFAARTLDIHRADFERALWGADDGRQFRSVHDAISTSSLYCLVPLASAAEKYYEGLGIRASCASR
ncbi:serine/threonine-protein kinase [Frankia sp. AgPm24]|uniref:serine/threonine-protein kinase n=1 Tax=Frankia sp. AgPm24 TaxID=631128 RepID=UPI0027E2713F|nr:serine/threonine-protein kinase [Frankia sp. AgPm24]